MSPMEKAQLRIARRDLEEAERSVKGCEALVAHRRTSTCSWADQVRLLRQRSGCGGRFARFRLTARTDSEESRPAASSLAPGQSAGSPPEA